VEVVLFLLAAAGAVLWNRERERAAARLFGLGAAVCLGLAAASTAWGTPARLGLGKLLVPGLGLCVLPATHAAVEIGRRFARGAGGKSRAPTVVGLLALIVVPTALCLTHDLGRPWAGGRPLEIGLGERRRALVELLSSRTDPGARILWEDRVGEPNRAVWTPLLPLLTDRAYLGGLDPDAGVDHAYASLSGSNLAGRRLGAGSVGELAAFCRRYIVGWVVCWTEAAKERFQGWKEACLLAHVTDGEDGWIFSLPKQSFTLQGQARFLRADCQHIALADLVPENGRVVLSFHYQAGLVVSPSRVQVEREPDPYDPIPLIRLTLPGPVARVTLRWKPR
jgi:hypothetical protein